MARSKRIQYLSELTQGYDTVLDIGTDHGFVLEIAFKKNYIKKAIATDLRIEPLKQAQKNLRNYPATCLLSDGFLNVKEPFDLCIIAGMGSFLICEILEHAPKEDRTYILQANDKIEHLRAYLEKNNFLIIDEYVVLDKFYYVILKVKRGSMHLTQKDIILGPILKMKPEAIPYYAHKASHLRKIMSKVDNARQIELKEVLQYYEQLIYDKI